MRLASLETLSCDSGWRPWLAVKRIAREIFRRHRRELPAMDLVVRLQAPVADATRAELNTDLLQLLQRLPRP